MLPFVMVDCSRCLRYPLDTEYKFRAPDKSHLNCNHSTCVKTTMQMARVFLLTLHKNDKKYWNYADVSATTEYRVLLLLNYRELKKNSYTTYVESVTNIIQRVDEQKPSNDRNPMITCQIRITDVRLNLRALLDILL